MAWMGYAKTVAWVGDARAVAAAWVGDPGRQHWEAAVLLVAR